MQEPLPEGDLAAPGTSPLNGALCCPAEASSAQAEAIAALAFVSPPPPPKPYPQPLALSPFQSQETAAGGVGADAGGAPAAASREKRPEAAVQMAASRSAASLNGVVSESNGLTEYYDALEEPSSEEQAEGSTRPDLQQPRHRRGSSADSGNDTGDEAAAAQGTRRYWRSFNRDYSSWDSYWDAVGVEQRSTSVPESGGRAAAAAEEDDDAGVLARVTNTLHSVEALLSSSYFSSAILISLFLIRGGWLRVEPDSPGAGATHSGSRGSGHGGDVPDAASQALHRQQSLARVAAEVRSRMVFGGRSTAAVAATPKHAVASDAVVSLVSSGGSASPSLKASNTLDAGTAAAARQDLELQRQRSGTAEAAPRGGAASREHGRQMHAPSCFSCFTICGSRPAVNVP